MEWINEKAKTLKQGAIRAMFDRANTMTGVISLGIGEPDMPTPKLVCEACKDALGQYLAVRRPISGRDREALFLSRNNRRISRSTVNLLV